MKFKIQGIEVEMDDKEKPLQSVTINFAYKGDVVTPSVVTVKPNYEVLEEKTESVPEVEEPKVTEEVKKETISSIANVFDEII